ncbi:hypothetical protein GOODEAATRI_032736 [Goodea atripinnis]|uniref:Uncharacterized protein n=1 Tax=Goodea atripinnis TaxID=208336 RepID=A0ABV0NGL8_9TELE
MLTADLTHMQRHPETNSVLMVSFIKTTSPGEGGDGDWDRDPLAAGKRFKLLAGPQKRARERCVAYRWEQGGSAREGPQNLECVCAVCLMKEPGTQERSSGL